MEKILLFLIAGAKRFLKVRDNCHLVAKLASKSAQAAPQRRIRSRKAMRKTSIIYLAERTPKPVVPRLHHMPAV